MVFKILAKVRTYFPQLHGFYVPAVLENNPVGILPTKKGTVLRGTIPLVITELRVVGGELSVRGNVFQ